MASTHENGVQIERKMSYGIGGAGNIRRPSEVIYPPRTNPDGTPRRRSSVFTISPGTSPEGKRASLMDLFKRKGSVSEAPSKPTVEEGVAFNKVDLGGKRDG